MVTKGKVKVAKMKEPQGKEKTQAPKMDDKDESDAAAGSIATGGDISRRNRRWREAVPTGEYYLKPCSACVR